MTSCAEDELDNNLNQYNDLIKSELAEGRIVSIYRYNNIEKIEEKEGTFYYSRYLYDNNDRLIKIESAADASILTSSTPVEKTELMTANNSTISSHQYFGYDANGNLLAIENYYKPDDDFELSSKQSFEFVDGKISKRSLHDETGEITQFTVYEYDETGNVINEKFFNYNFSESTEPNLITENSFKHDDKINPFVIYKDLGYPGLYTNPNNIIETITTRHEVILGFEEHSTARTSYEYNLDNYPTKVTTGNNEYEYKYL